MTNKIVAICIFLLGILAVLPFVSAQDTPTLTFETPTWYADSGAGAIPSDNIYLDADTTHGVTYRVTPTSTNRGFDYFSLEATPGTHIVAYCWIKTTAGTAGSGAKLGGDYYSAAGYGIAPTWSSSIAWGTTDWTLLTWDFTVPATVQCVPESTGNNYNTSQYYEPATLVFWTNVESMYYPTGAGTAYFSGLEVYVNPTEDLTPPPSATPTPTTEDSINPLYMLLGLAGFGAILLQLYKKKSE